MDGRRPAAADERLTVGQVPERFGVTVRTLHHDDVGLLRPSERSAGGYRLCTEDDLLRLPADSAEAMEAAEAARRQIHERFYDLSPELHRALADMCVGDPRFTKTHQDLEPGPAQYVRDAIHAHAAHAARVAG
ncbi:MerR family transcriptional regulator [Kocuria arenosa]|uniref:MerR family transcriptional regulator n=1 Tax=Kocuria arenosa TaxID=3071446 RepID=UPI0034D3FF28